MTKSLISLLLLGLALPLACKSEDDTPDPLATRDGFCMEWAKAACSDAVIDACNAPSADDCHASQKDFCLGLVAKEYRSSKFAQDCIDAVGAAYADADLSATELPIVTRLGAPCDKLTSGNTADGDRCTTNDDCDVVDGSTCIIKLGGSKGTCGVPEEIAAGEACDAPTQVCKAGYFCDGENCIAYKKTSTGTCEGDYMCKPEDHCVLAAGATTGTCEARAALSEACTSDDDCQSHYCAIAQGDTEGKCTSKLRLGLNEPLCDNLR